MLIKAEELAIKPETIHGRFKYYTAVSSMLITISNKYEDSNQIL